MAVTSLQFAGLTIPPAAALNSAAGARTITAAGARALVPLTYGTDRVAALVLNVLPAAGDANSLLVQCLWGHACSAIDDVTLNALDLPSGSSVVHYTGSQSTPNAALVAAFEPLGITYTDTLAGFAYSVVSIPVRSFTGQLELTASVSGRKLYDPRKDSTNGGAGTHRLANPSTWEWSDNPALALADWLNSSVYGPAEPVQWSSVITAATACDSLIGSPTEKRRLIGLTIAEPVAMPELAEALRAYAGCWLVPSSAGLRLVPDADASSVATYDHQSGQIAEMAPLVLRDRGNSPTAVEVIYTDNSQTPWRDASATASLPGAGSTLPWRLSQVRLPGVQRYSQALREATERLNKLTLAELTTEIEVFDIGIRHDIADIVTVSLPVGLVSKAMRITGIEMPAVGRWRLALTEHDPLAYSNSVITQASNPDTPYVVSAGPPDDVASLTGTLTNGAIRWAWPQSTIEGAETRLRLGGSNWATAAPLWEGRATGYTQLVDTAGTYTVRAKYVALGQESVTARSASVVVTDTDVNAPGSSQATVYLYQWGSGTQPGNPSGQTTYSWGTGAHTAYTGGNGWQVTVPSNPGTPGSRLWIARKAVVAPAGTLTSTVPWASGFTIYAESVNGAAGATGIQTATPTVYLWAASIPTVSGSGTYTWAAGSIGTPPPDWTESPGTGTPGQTLWGATVRLVDSSAATTTAIDWSTASITPRGYQGLDGSSGTSGISARRAYTVTYLTSLGSGEVQTAGIDSMPPANSVFGNGLTWNDYVTTPAVNQTLFQSDGLYDPVSNLVTWQTPYVSALKVGNLSALAVNTGALTVNDQLNVGPGGTVKSNNYTSGSGGAGWKLTDSSAELPATGVRGLLTASQINTNGLLIRNDAGQVIFGSGSAIDPTPYMAVQPGWLNSNQQWSDVAGTGRPSDYASVAGGGNLLKNPSFLNRSADGWTNEQNNGMTTAVFGGNLETYGWSDYSLNGVETGYIYNPGGYDGDAAYYDISPGYSTVRPNRYYMFSVLVKVFRGGVQLYGVTRDAAANIVEYTGFTAALFSALPSNGSRTDTLKSEDSYVPSTLYGQREECYERLWYWFQAPSNGVFHRPHLRMTHGPSSTNTVIFVARAMLTEVAGPLTSPVPFDMGPGIWQGAQKITNANITTFIDSAAINIAQINTASIGSLSAITATIGLLRSRASGARTEIADDVIRVYDSGNVLRVKLGDLS